MSYFYGSEKSRCINGIKPNINQFDVEVIVLIKTIESFGDYESRRNYILNELNKLPRKPDGNISTIPQYIRLGIYYMALLEYKKENNKKNKGKHKPFQNTLLLNDLGLSKNTFQKWQLYPQKDAEFYHEPPFTPKVYRNGIKKRTLLRLLRFLITSQNADYFADVFGGTGVVTCSVSGYFKKCYLNEYEDQLFNLLRCIKDRKDDMLDSCFKIIINARNMKDSDPRFKEGLKIVEEKNLWEYNQNVTAPLLSIYKEAEQYLKNTSFNSNVTAAAYLYFTMSFKSQVYSSSASIDGLYIDTVYDYLAKMKYDYKNKHADGIIYKKSWSNKLKEQLNWKDLSIKSNKNNADKSEISEWSALLQRVILNKEDYRTFYNRISKGTDNKSLIWYFDPPYFMTSQYDNHFTDTMHVELIKFVKEISNKGGKWVFSCKDKITNQSEEIKTAPYRSEDGKPIIKRFEHYFAGFLKNISFEVGQNNEYILKKLPQSKYPKNHDLYVYKLKNERNSEIIITNFDCPLSAAYILNCVHNKNKQIPVFEKETFEDHFKKMLDEIRTDIMWN